jgi:UDP-N-acetylmuramoyl-tripeptide--D-alanyl-D-alanine ligase
VDGHDFAPAALQKGAVGALVERPTPGPHILVRDLVAALAKMARAYREVFTGPVVGITGSAGKTTTKEFVAAALGTGGPVLKTEGNRNTEYTAPLLWAELTEAHGSAVVEMSMRGFGQVAHLAEFSRPTIGLITNIGFSHLAMVGSRDGIAQAKGELLDALPSDGVAILWAEDEYREVLKKRAGARKVVTFGASAGADSTITSYRPLDWRTCEVEGLVFGEAWKAVLPAVGRHIASNAAAAIAVSRIVGLDLSASAQCLSDCTLPPMRMQVVPMGGATILLDTYNASPPSMIAAIETLAELPVEGRRRAVLGEMRELGDHTEEAHRQVGRELAKHGLDDVLFVGEAMRWAMEEAGGPGDAPGHRHFTNEIEEVREFLSGSRHGDAVLVKGSRALELERAIDGLS